MRIADIRESYKVSHRICGAGSFGTVRSCTHRSTRQKFAVKSITKAGNANIITLLKNELALVQRVNHRHVVMVVDVIQDLDYIHIGKHVDFFLCVVELIYRRLQKIISPPRPRLLS
jgi:serine/threonine protein kinase